METRQSGGRASRDNNARAPACLSPRTRRIAFEDKDPADPLHDWTPAEPQLIIKIILVILACVKIADEALRDPCSKDLLGQVPPPRERKSARTARFGGLDALLQCLHLYVESNSSRFRFREQRDPTGRIVKVVLRQETPG